MNIEKAIQNDAIASQYKVYPASSHVHNGIDSLRIDASSLARFPPSPLQGAIFYSDGNQWVLLSAGTNGFFLQTQGNGAPIWGAVTDFGDGSDGSVSIGTNTSLVRDMFYGSLTVLAGNSLFPAGNRIFCSGTLTLSGTIDVSGRAGGDGGAGGTADGSGTFGAAGTAGSAGIGIVSGTLKEPGNSGAGSSGMSGGANGSPNTRNGGAGTAETNCATANSGASGGNSGKGSIKVPASGFTDNSSIGGAGGSATQRTKLSSLLISEYFQDTVGGIGVNGTAGGGAGGGGGIGVSSADALGGGGGGGGGGGCGGLVWICAQSIVINNGGVITAVGGKGGNGGIGGGAINAGLGGENRGGGGGGGGGGGNGGVIVLIYKSLSNSGTLTTSAGIGGTHGVGSNIGSLNSASDGIDGAAGSAGVTYLKQV